jgi:serpin B
MSKFLPLQEFLDISEKYCAPYEELVSAQQVNDWCDEKTHGKIKKILDELDPAIQMILINAVYFKGEWDDKFNANFTSKKDFYNRGTEISQVDTMNQISNYLYYEDNKIQAIELPYNKDGMSALIILPRENIDINKYITSLNNDKNLNELIKKLRYYKVDLDLPKFELEFFSGLNKVLMDMGMETAFSDMANFSGFKEEAQLKIDNVLHKTYIKVDEKGTEAAAVTVVVVVPTSSSFDEPEIIYKMKVNRPFLFFLRSNKLPPDNDLLFMSKIEIIE